MFHFEFEEGAWFSFRISRKNLNDSHTNFFPKISKKTADTVYYTGIISGPNIKFHLV